MSKIKDYLLELEEDFEHLTHQSMKWDRRIWEPQAKFGRFNVCEHDWTYSHIYWFESYAEIIAAKLILRQLEEDFSIKTDESTCQWVILTNYESLTWKC